MVIASMYQHIDSGDVNEQERQTAYTEQYKYAFLRNDEHQVGPALGQVYRPPFISHMRRSTTS